MIDDVKRSGAVSPATRATAITTPGEDAADRRRQDDARVTSASACTPSARLASRRLRGTSASTSCVARATIGSIRIGERERAVDRALPVADDEQPEDEDADHDRRHAVQHVEHDPEEARATRGRAYSDM